MTNSFSQFIAKARELKSGLDFRFEDNERPARPFTETAEFKTRTGYFAEANASTLDSAIVVPRYDSALARLGVNITPNSTPDTDAAISVPLFTWLDTVTIDPGAFTAPDLTDTALALSNITPTTSRVSVTLTRRLRKSTSVDVDARIQTLIEGSLLRSIEAQSVAALAESSGLATTVSGGSATVAAMIGGVVSSLDADRLMLAVSPTFRAMCIAAGEWSLDASGRETVGGIEAVTVGGLTGARGVVGDWRRSDLIVSPSIHYTALGAEGGMVDGGTQIVATISHAFAADDRRFARVTLS